MKLCSSSSKPGHKPLSSSHKSFTLKSNTQTSNPNTIFTLPHFQPLFRICTGKGYSLGNISGHRAATALPSFVPTSSTPQEEGPSSPQSRSSSRWAATSALSPFPTTVFSNLRLAGVLGVVLGRACLWKLGSTIKGLSRIKWCLGAFECNSGIQSWS